MALSVFTSGLRPSFRSCATLARAHVQCRPMIGYLGSSILSAKRWQSTVPYKNLIGAVSHEEYNVISQRVDEMVKVHLEKAKFAEKMSASKDVPTPISRSQSMTVTGNLMAWERASITSPFRLRDDGVPFISNSDKEILLKLLAVLIEKNVVKVENEAIVVNEGCDIGDYLSLILPLLKTYGAGNVKVVLTNGKMEKLKAAASASLILLPEGHVFPSLENAFDGIPEKVKQNPNFQKLFLFFRLMIVERPDRIFSFLKQRLKFMRPNDIAIGSFLLDDEVSRQTMTKYYKMEAMTKNASDGYTIFRRAVTKNVQAMFRAKGVAEGDLDLFNTAFSPEKVQSILQENGGKILHMNQISTATDDGHPIHVIGTIFKGKF